MNLSLPPAPGQLLAEVICVSFLTIISCATAGGQESDPPQISQITSMRRTVRSDSIQSNGVVGALRPEAGWEDILGNTIPWGPFDFHFNASASLVYNDNIFVQEKNKVGDFITTISPQLLIGTGDYIEKQENWLTLSYVPSFLIFASHPGEDAIDHDVRLGFEWHPANWTFGIKQDYQRASGAVVEVGERVTRNIYDSNLYAKYDLDAKTDFEIDVSQTLNDYPEPLLSFATRSVSGWINYEATPKIDLSFGLTGAFLDIDNAPNQDYQTVVLRGNYDIAENIHLQGSVGAELREFQGGESNKWNGIFSAELSARPWRDGRLLFGAYRKTETSLVAIDQNYIVTGINAGISQTVAEKYTLNLSGGFNTSDYYATQPRTTVNGAFDYFFIRTGVDWAATDQFGVGAFYQYQKNSTDGSTGFDNNISGINFNYHF